jgi:hypothetical protein
LDIIGEIFISELERYDTSQKSQRNQLATLNLRMKVSARKDPEAKIDEPDRAKTERVAKERVSRFMLCGTKLHRGRAVEFLPDVFYLFAGDR